MWNRTKKQTSRRDQYLQVNAEFEFSSQTLIVRYQIDSLTRDKIAIFDGLMRATARGLKWDRFLAYVSFESPSTLAIKRVVPPLPKLKNVEFAYVPLAHIIHDGTHQGEIKLSVPVVEYNPYYPPSPKSVYSKVLAQYVELILEYTIISENISVIEQKDIPNLYQVMGAPIHLRQIRLTVTAPEPGIPVRQRLDMFERI